MKKKTTDFTVYDRHPILLGPHCIALIRLYRRTDYLNDVTFENDRELLMHIGSYEAAAKQFIKQLEGQYCDLFLLALKDEISKLLKK